ncbi:MAG TPA: peptidase E [Acidimicrobiales bacterium]|jgi:peptidase E|nr:peptidase E [Acidimicrobiales bacterium]
MAARLPTIVATSIGFQLEGPDPTNLRPGPSYRMAADLARAGEYPKVCILATATGDDLPRLAAIHNAFAKIGFLSSHLTLFPMPNYSDVRAHLLAQDVIWVGGGSTANLLALWRLHGLDLILRECWEAGVVLQGVSAGSICWHLGGTTDSFGSTLQPITNGLAFLPYSNSPHYDVEEQRRPLIHRLVADGTLPDGYATDNGAGLVFEGTELVDAFTEVEGKLAYSLVSEGGTTREEPLETRLL